MESFVKPFKKFLGIGPLWLRPELFGEVQHRNGERSCFLNLATVYLFVPHEVLSGVKIMTTFFE